MSDCKKCRFMFDEAFFEELDEVEEAFFMDHLKDCQKCRQEYENNKLLLSGTKSQTNSTNPKLVGPSPDFWEGYVGRLNQRMVSEGVFSNKKIKKPLIPSLILGVNSRLAFQALMVVFLLVVGVFIGRVFFPSSNLEFMQPTIPTIASSTAGSAVYQHTRNFIERSKVMLLAINNFDPATENSLAMDLPFQQQISKDLVRQASQLKSQLSGLRQRKLRELIVDLEVILLQIANLESGSQLDTIQMVKNGENIRGILFKIHIMDVRRSLNKPKEEKVI